MRSLLLFLALLSAALVCGLPASAAPQDTSAPQVIADHEGPGFVGIDRTGRVLVVYRGGDGFVVRERRPAHGFGPELPIASGPPTVRPWDPGGFNFPTFDVSNSGHAAFVYGRQEPCGEPPLSCTYSLFARVGTSARSLDHEEFISAHTERHVSALNERGDLAVTWQTVGRPMFAAEDSAVRMALRPNGKRFRKPVEVSDPGAGEATMPTVAINDAGDIVVAWQQEHPKASSTSGSVSIYASYRHAGGSFGRPQLIWKRQPGADGFNPHAAIDSAGRAAVMFDSRSKRIALSGADGRFGESRHLGPPGDVNSIVSATDDAIIAGWSDVWDGSTFVTRAVAGGAFGPAKRLDPFTGWGQGALDAYGNLLVAGTTRPPDSRPYIGVLSRFDFAPIGPPMEIPRSFSPYTGYALDLASNDSGAAAALFELFPDPNKPGGPLVLLDRPADRTAPAVTVSRVRMARRGFTARITCSELCRISGTVQARRRGTAKTSGSRTVRPGRVGKLTVKLSRRTRSRLRRQLRSGAGLRLRAVVRASDTFGNARTRRFAASKRVLR